ncbi:MAG: Glu/Leu/Phe/Val dehydrogenase dimerization domain-containing protein [Mycobacterium sp.]
MTDSSNIYDLDVPGYERVRVCEDSGSGLRAIVAIHSTTLGPALGGTRFLPYVDDDDALTDVKRLAAAMTHKAAAAGLNLGGGKAVIIGDPANIKTSQLLHAYGRLVDSLKGTYITAADIGTSSDDLDIVGEVTDFAVGKNVAAGGLGDSGRCTALGVVVSMRAAVEKLHPRRTLAGLRVGVEGAGKVGARLIGMLLDEGAHVYATEVHQATHDMLHDVFPSVDVVDDLFDVDIDVYAPCARGATLTNDTAQRLSAGIVCGAANNQLLTDDVEATLDKRGIVWIPDYVANSGGLIQVDAERRGSSLDEAQRHVEKLGESVTAILDRSASDGVTAASAARQIVEHRLVAGAR